MSGRKHCTIGLSIALAASSIAVPGSTHASDRGGEQAPIRLYATASTAPIGTVSVDLGATGPIKINGHRAVGEAPVWSGDLLQAQASARVTLDSVCNMRLSAGTTLRMAVARDRGGDNGNGRVLIASLIAGAMDVKLVKDAAAYVETRDSTFTMTAGTAFRAIIRDGAGEVEAKAGTVSMVKSAAQARALTIVPVDHGNTLKVTAKHSISIKVQVLEDQKPVADVPVVFAVDSGGVGVGRFGIGTVSADTLSTATNDKGIAIMPFEAGAKPGKAKVSATIQGTRVSWIGDVEVKGPTWNRTNVGILFGILGACAVGGGIAIAKVGGKESIQVQPPQVKP